MEKYIERDITTVVTEAMKWRSNRGKNNNLSFYRDSNKNEIDLLLKEGSNVSGFEIKSSMTYHSEFAKALLRIDSFVKEPIAERAIIYAGEMENLSADIKLVNYRNFAQLL